ncbi:MAG: hypothetical protein A3H91_08180 [Gammaproteobacteria bacterium RIFCSPLOWO2_02_FULL_61_13]|nr:MAG: hypothetical protein A3H91_08180 [Gammaproteobacteria bacterium RIFCSPLOWO2_02_FULL_61_13]
MSSGEKRLHKRVPHSAPVVVRVKACPQQPELEGVSFPCATTDISEGGVRLQTDRLLPFDCLLELEAKVLDRTFLLTGRVIWSGQVEEHLAYTGVQFPAQEDDRLWPWKIQVARVFQSGK